jgi:histidinol dehydrogenase
MSIPIIDDIAKARATILRRVPLDEVVVPQHVLDGIAALFGEPLRPAEAVERIIKDVRTRGDAALHEWTQRLDKATLENIEVSPERMTESAATLEHEVLSAMSMMTHELENFHRHQMRNSWVDFHVEGTRGQIVRPLHRIGIYVPGGAAPLPSSLLHAAIPARIAGVQEIVVCSPPQGGKNEPSEVVLAAAYFAEVEHVFALGGAQAIAAMAYGTESVPRVDKIVGPGNLFVVLAKRAVYGSVGIESLPGPTETLVIADEHANPVSVAADLLAQAEHVLASAILVTPSAVLAKAVQEECDRQLQQLPAANRQAASEALEQRGGIVLVSDLEIALDVANGYAPEHLCLLLEDPWAYVGHIRNAGGIFLGERSFEVLGDYTAGPSHIMPTGGTARYASPVNVDDFRKVISLVGLNQQGLERIGPSAMKLAEAEGLFAHAAAVRARIAHNEE